MDPPDRHGRARGSRIADLHTRESARARIYTPTWPPTWEVGQAGALGHHRIRRCEPAASPYSGNSPTGCTESPRLIDTEGAESLCLKVTFDDVAGIDEAENELVEIVDFPENPAKVQLLARAAQGRRWVATTSASRP